MWLLILLLALAFVTVMGHGAWVLLAFICRTLFSLEESPSEACRCPRCRRLLLPGERRCTQCGAGRSATRIAEITDLEATERQLRRWYERSELKARVAQRLLSRVQGYRRQLLHADGAAIPKLASAAERPAAQMAPAATLLARQPQKTTTPVIAESANHGVDTSPTKPFGDLVAAMAPRNSARPVASPPSLSPAISPAAPPPPAPKPLPSPPAARPSPPEPRRTFAEMLATFMDERNIRWGELVGGLLIVCSSIALVISLWDTLNTIPYFQFLILVGVSAAVFGAGLYTEHRWKLESTSRGILIIATLLVPLNFVAMAATANAGWDWFALVAELISLGLFVALVERAARVLVPVWRWQLTCAVVGNSGLLLLARHHLPPVWLMLVGGLAVACHAGAIGAALVSLRREMFEPSPGNGMNIVASRKLFGADRANELFILVGASSFAFGAAVCLLVASSKDYATAINYFSPLIALAALPICMSGIAVMHGLKERQELAGWQTAGTTVALVGALVMLAAQALAWPLPLALLAAGLMNFLALSAIGFRAHLAVAHTAALASLAVVYVTASHLALGHFADVPRDLLGKKMIELALNQQTGALLVGLFIALAAISEVLVRRPKLFIDARHYAAACLATAATSLSIIFAHAYVAEDAGRWLVLRACTVYGLVTLSLNLRLKHRLLSYLGSALIAVGLIDAGFLRPAMALECPWMAACLAHSTIVMAISIAFERSVKQAASDMDRSIVQPLRTTASISSLAALASLLWIGEQPPLALALHLGWLAAMWLVMAVLQRSTSWFAAFQIALTASALSAITAWLNGQPWVQHQAAALLDPRSLQAYGIGLALLCAAWSVARIVLRRTGSAQEFLDCDLVAVDRWTFYWLSICSVALAAWNLLPSAIAELSTGGPIVPGSLRTFAFGPLAWLLVSAQTFALLLVLWHRWRTQEMACGILLLVTTAMLAAGPFAGSFAAASALRWSLAVAFLFGSALVWLRKPLARTAHKLCCRCKFNARDLQIAQSLLLALCAAPVLLITGLVIAMQHSGLRPAGPQPGIWFAALGFSVSYLIPVALIAATLLGYAVREASPGYAFSAGLVTTLTIGGGYALNVHQFGPLEAATLLQLCTIAAALWAIAWLTSQRKILEFSGRAEPPSARRLLRVQLGLATSGNLLLLLPALEMLAVFSPEAFAAARSWIAAAGSPLGWLAFVSAIGAGSLAGWQWQRRLRPEVVGLVGMAALGLGSCSITWTGVADVWAYRALMLGWASYALSVVAAAWRATSAYAAANNAALLESLVRSAALWVRIAGLLALALGLKTAIFYRSEQLWAAAAIGLAGAACAAMAVWRRREPWAFVAGLSIHLAATIVVWHWNFADDFQFADVWLLLLQANLIAGAAVAIIWLFAHQRMYSDRLLSASAGPLLSLQMALLMLGNLLALGIPLAALIMQPGNPPASLLQAGSRSGWLAWLLGGAAIVVYCQKIAKRELPYVLATLLLGIGVLASGAAAWHSEPWLAYHVLLIAWIASGFALLAAALIAAPRMSWLKSLARTESIIALMSAIEASIAVLALRGAWDDPGRPYWPIAATLSASLLAAIVAVAIRKPDHKYASGALVALAIIAAAVGTQRALAVEIWLIQLGALGVQALLWSLLDHWLEKNRAGKEGELPPFSHAAASLSVGLLCVTILCNLLRAAGWIPADLTVTAPFDFIRLPPSSISAPAAALPWMAWGAAAAAVIVLLRDTRARFSLRGLYAIGLAGIVLAVERNTVSPLSLAQNLALGAAGYLLTASLLQQFAGRFTSLAIALPHTSQADANWFSPTQFLIGMIACGVSQWLVVASASPADRLPGSLAAALLLAGAIIHTRSSVPLWKPIWRSTALALAVAVATQFGWTWLVGEGDVFWLERQIIAAAVLFLAILTCQFTLPKLLRDSSEWTESARRALIACGGLLLPLLAAVLVQEWVLHAPGLGVDMAAAAKAAMASMLAGTTVLAILYAVSPEHDPLRLSLRGRMAYVYSAELFALLVVVHFRTAMPQLIPIGILEKYWTLIVMLVAFAGAGLSEFFERRRLSVLSQPLARTALMAPLAPALGHWLRPAIYIDAEAVLFLVAAFYGLQATLKRSLTLACLAVIAGNTALWLLWHRLDIDFFHHPQLWLIPLALVVLVAEFIQRGRLSPQQAGAIRYFALSVIYVSSTIDVFMSHSGRDLSMPLVFVLMGLSVAGVLAGILLQVRSFLYLGVTFLLVALSIVVFHAAWDRGHMWVFWLSGIAIGAAIIALFAVFEKHRNDLAPALDRFKQWS